MRAGVCAVFIRLPRVARARGLRSGVGTVYWLGKRLPYGAVTRFFPVRDPLARFPRRIVRVPFLGLRHFCERVRAPLDSKEAARPGRRRVCRG